MFRTFISALADACWRTAALMRKELLTLLKDPANRIILLVPALLQALLFGYALSFELKHAPYAVLEPSRSAASAALLARLDSTGVFKRVATLSSASQIAPAIDSGRALAVITFPPDFAQRLAQGQAAPVQVVLDARNSSTAAAAGSQIAAIAARYNEQELGLAPGIRVQRRAWFNPNLDSGWHLLPGLIASLSMIQTMLLAALSVAREREQGTFDQLLVTPLQMALVADAFANGGRIMQPYLVDAVLTTGGIALETSSPKVWRTATTPERAGIIDGDMAGVVASGTGTAADVAGVRVTGKTGTAENATGTDHAWFIGSAERGGHKIVMAVIVEEGGFGGRAAAGIAHRIIQTYFAG